MGRRFDALQALAGQEPVARAIVRNVAALNCDAAFRPRVGSAEFLDGRDQPCLHVHAVWTIVSIPKKLRVYRLVRPNLNEPT